MKLAINDLANNFKKVKKKQPSTAGAVNDSLFLWEWMLFFFRSMDHILNSCCKQKLIKSKEVKKKLIVLKLLSAR